MGKTIMGATVSLDGFIADEKDEVAIVRGDCVTHLVYDVAR